MDNVPSTKRSKTEDRAALKTARAPLLAAVAAVFGRPIQWRSRGADMLVLAQKYDGSGVVARLVHEMLAPPHLYRALRLGDPLSSVFRKFRDHLPLPMPVWKMAMQCCDTEALLWVYNHARRTLRASSKETDVLIVNDSLKLLQKLSVERLSHDKALQYAAMWGRTAIVEWLHSRYPTLCDRSAIQGALLQKRKDVVTWLSQNCQACQSNLANEFGIIERATLDRDMESVKFYCSVDACFVDKAVSCALRYFEDEEQPLIDEIMESFPDAPLKMSVAIAVRTGHSDFVKTYFKRGQNVIDLVCSAPMPNLDLVKWLHERGASCTTRGMNMAAARGYLDIVKWLHAHRSEGCTAEAMDLAVSHGFQKVVVWLHDNRSEGCTSEAMDFAANCGYFTILQWLHRHGKACTTDAMDLAAQRGYMKILQWLHKNRSEGCTADAMDLAAEHGHLTIVQWLHANRTEGCTSNAMDLAAQRGHLDVVKWLHENRSEGCTTNAMDWAARHGHLQVVQWLHEHRSEGCTTLAMDWAAENGHLGIIKWLHENRSEGCTTDAMDVAAKKGLFTIVKWLHLNRTEGCSIRGILKAATHGHLKIVRYLHNAYPSHQMTQLIHINHINDVKIINFLVKECGVDRRKLMKATTRLSVVLQMKPCQLDAIRLFIEQIVPSSQKNLQ